MTIYTEHDLSRALTQEARSAATPSTEAILSALSAGLLRRQRRQAVVASAVVLAVAGAIVGLAVGSSNHPDRPASTPPVRYQHACALEPDACLPGTTGTAPSALSRPLALPGLASGGRCPVTSGRPSTSPYLRGQEYGDGPVRFVVDQTGRARGTVRVVHPDSSGWYAVTNTLLTRPGYRGPILVRGQRLDRPGSAYLDGSESTSFIDPPFPDANTQHDGSRTTPASIFVRAPGCYGFQIDGTDFTSSLVLDLTAAPNH